MARKHTEIDARLEATSKVRDAALSGWGKLDGDVLTHLLNPSFMGGPRWPALRQAWRVARKGEARLLASDGLADPFDEGDEARNGFELELFALTRADLALPGSWLWDMVWQMSQQVASHGGIAGLLDELGLLTTELYDVGIPPSHRAKFVNDSERVCVLLGLTDPAELPARIAGPLSEIRLVNVKLLTLAELEFVLQGGAAARTDLAKRFAKQGDPLASSLDRQSVV